MSCKYMSKALNGEIKCRYYKRYINYKVDCENCSEAILTINKPIKKVSKKRMKLEKERDKNLVKSGKCDYCKRYSDRLDPHEVYGGSNRKRSIENRFIALLCRECHQNEEILQELKKQYQRRYEYTHSREEFIKLIGKSYLKEEK